MTTQNETAERLRYYWREAGMIDTFGPDFELALAAERRAAIAEHIAEDEEALSGAFQAGLRKGSRDTVERIRERLIWTLTASDEVRRYRADVDAILDKEAARMSEQRRVEVSPWTSAHFIGGCNGCHDRGDVKAIRLTNIELRVCRRCAEIVRKALR